jgi:hypothetical protein
MIELCTRYGREDHSRHSHTLTKYPAKTLLVTGVFMGALLSVFLCSCSWTGDGYIRDYKNRADAFVKCTKSAQGSNSQKWNIGSSTMSINRSNVQNVVDPALELLRHYRELEDYASRIEGPRLEAWIEDMRAAYEEKQPLITDGLADLKKEIRTQPSRYPKCVSQMYPHGSYFFSGNQLCVVVDAGDQGGHYNIDKLLKFDVLPILRKAGRRVPQKKDETSSG